MTQGSTMTHIATIDQFSATGTGRLIELFSHLWLAAQRRSAERREDRRFHALVESDYRMRADLQAARDRHDEDTPVAPTVAPTVAFTPVAAPVATATRPAARDERALWLRHYPVAYA